MELKDEIIELISKVLSVRKEELKEDGQLYHTIGVDSTEMVEFTVSLAKHFGVEIETNEVTKFSTPVEIAGVIGKKKQNQ